MANRDIQKIGIVGAIGLLAMVITFIGLSFGDSESLSKVAKTVASIGLAVFGIWGQQ